ncbi:MAG: DUF4097 family beta strand repeat-containing protein [Acidobacteriota bacterium]
MRHRWISSSLGLLVIMVFPSIVALAGTENFEIDDLKERDEFRKTYQLSPGARVDIHSINGAVDVETTNGNTAEVHIIRSAHSREDLQFRKVIVEQTSSGLSIHGENERGRGRHAEVHQRVLLKVPHQIELTASSINGRVTVGELEGPAKLASINGRIEVAKAVGYLTLSSINGSVTVTVARLNQRGIDMTSINGRIDLRFTEDVNADLAVHSINGKVNAEVPNVTVEGKIDRNNFRARIGSGGIPISLTSINGNVRLSMGTL